MFRHIDKFNYCNETIDMSKYTSLSLKYEEDSEKLKSMISGQLSPYQHCQCIEAKTATTPILALAYGTQKRLCRVNVLIWCLNPRRGIQILIIKAHNMNITTEAGSYK